MECLDEALSTVHSSAFSADSDDADCKSLLARLSEEARVAMAEATGPGGLEVRSYTIDSIKLVQPAGDADKVDLETVCHFAFVAVRFADGWCLLHSD